MSKVRIAFAPRLSSTLLRVPTPKLPNRVPDMIDKFKTTQIKNQGDLLGFIRPWRNEGVSAFAPQTQTKQLGPILKKKGSRWHKNFMLVGDCTPTGKQSLVSKKLQELAEEEELRKAHVSQMQSKVAREMQRDELLNSSSNVSLDVITLYI